MDKKKIFNQSVLDKMSTPEQLNKQIIITTRTSWAAIVGGLIIVVAALIWSMTGWFLVTKTATGIIVPTSDAHPVTTAVTGIVKDVYVEKGDLVKEGDKLFSYESEVYDDAIEEIEERKSIVQAVTLDSKNDVVNTDTSELISIKLQRSTTGTEEISSNITLSEYQAELKRVQKQENKAKEAVESAKKQYEKAYLDYTAGLITEAELNAAKAAYTEAETAYSTLVAQENSINQQIKTAKVQKKIVNAGKNEQSKNLSRQFNATKEGILDSIDKELKQYDNNKDACIVTATMSGTIAEVNVTKGKGTSQGTEVVTIRKSTDEDNVMKCFISATDGKGIKEGMEVVVYPTYLDRQEYGHMEATVISVDNYYTNSNDITTAVGNAQLANSLMQMGPTIEFTCKLRTDDTASGYYWSSKQGREIEITESTLASADVVVEKNHPISTLVPYLKTKAYEFVAPLPEDK